MILIYTSGFGLYGWMTVRNHPLFFASNRMDISMLQGPKFDDGKSNSYGRNKTVRGSHWRKISAIVLAGLVQTHESIAYTEVGMKGKVTQKKEDARGVAQAPGQE